MRYLKAFNETRNEYPLMKDLMGLFEKYNHVGNINWDDLPYLNKKSVKETLEMIEGDGEVIYNGSSPRYIEKFGDIVLVVHGSIHGLTHKVYEYEIKVLSEKSKRSTQIGGSYGASGIIMNDYNYSLIMGYQECPTIVDPEVISKVINDFRKLIK